MMACWLPCCRSDTGRKAFDIKAHYKWIFKRKRASERACAHAGADRNDFFTFPPSNTMAALFILFTLLTHLRKKKREKWRQCLRERKASAALDRFLPATRRRCRRRRRHRSTKKNTRILIKYAFEMNIKWKSIWTIPSSTRKRRQSNLGTCTWKIDETLRDLGSFSCRLSTINSF